MFGLDQFSNTHKIINEGINEKLHFGAQVYISQDSQILADFAIGKNHPDAIDPLTELKPSTILPWMSCSKMLTAVAIAILNERRMLGYDQLVGDIIPEFSCNGKESITIKHLLTHTSGIRLLPLQWDKLSWEATVAAIAKMPIESNWVPGEKAGYHIGTSWLILGEIIRILDGRPVEQFLNEEIFTPLNMEHSGISISKDFYLNSGLDISGLYRTDTKSPYSSLEKYLDSLNLVRPGATGRGPIKELGQFMEMLLNKGSYANKRILSERSVEELSSRQREGLLDLTFNKTIDWGLGFMIDSKCHNRSYPYSFGTYCSEETFGHNGNQSSTAYVDPEHDLVVCFVFNGMPGEYEHNKRLKLMNDSIYQDLGLD
ncbi:serine hydrolase [Lentisphaera profundi]|uniref:Serine hydrolase n=1 Tax=Lentisphaera profundi TaxID=1658616 RepID=A0ABY7VN25_9BACT|nr:serine hydrolase domain-containing protein [Lentisphaera profundi]WDE95478.1 serine hydrolase [Lentisphaera profundi]